MGERGIESDDAYHGHAIPADALPIATYPIDRDFSVDTGWGPAVVLWVPACKHYPYHAHSYIGHLEADMWLVRDAADPECWSELHCPPTHWMPNGSSPEALHLHADVKNAEALVSLEHATPEPPR